MNRPIFTALLFAAGLTCGAIPHPADKLPDSEFFRVIPYGKNPQEVIKLFKLSNKGRSGKDFRPNSGLEWDRKPPRPALLKDSGLLGVGTLGKQVDIPIELLDESGIPRNAAEVRVGVPFPRGGVFSTENLQLRNESDQLVPASYGVLSKWPDGSIRYALVIFSAPLKAHEKVRWTLSAGSNMRHHPISRLQLKESAAGISITTDCLKAFIDKKKFNLLTDVEAYGKKAGSFAPEGIVLVDENGKKLSSTLCPPDDVAVEELLPERATVRIGGILGTPEKNGNQRYLVRLRFKTTTPEVKAEISIINAGLKNEFYDFNEVYLEFRPVFKVGTIAMGVKNGDNIGNSTFIRQLTDRRIAPGLNAPEKQGQLKDWIAVIGAAPDQRFAVGMADVALRWPKGVSNQNGAVRFELLPPLPGKDFGKELPHQLAYNFCEGKYRHFWGMAFTETLNFDFGGGSFDASGAEAGTPVIAVIPPWWYEKCGVFYGANAMIPGFGKRLMQALANVKESARRDRETGYLNYGDWYGERGINWGNNEYDTAYTYWLLFVMTGDRDFYRLGMAASRHQADTDTTHAFPDRRFIGGDNYHSIGHIGAVESAPSYYQPYGDTNGCALNGHTWVAGMLAAWELAGESRCCDMALLTGEQLRCQSLMSTRIGGQVRVTSWQLCADCVLYRTFLDPEYLTAAWRNFEIMEGERFADKGGIWLWEYQPGKFAEQALFMLGLGGQSMICYHRTTGDHRAEKAIIDVAKWIRENFESNPEYAFVYEQTWDHKNGYLLVCNMGGYVGPTVMYAALLTGDAKFKELSDKLMKMTLSRNFGAKKDFNMMALFCGEWMALRKEWTRRHPEDVFKYDRESFYQEYFSSQTPAFHARSRKTVHGVIRLKKANAELLITRHRCFEPGASSITVKDADGKIRAELKIPKDKEKAPKLFRLPLTGKAGELLHLEISDRGYFYWDPAVSPDYTMFMNTDGDYIFRRPNLRRYYFTVPAGTKEFTVRIFGFNPGHVGAVIRRPDGSVAAEMDECNLSSFNADASDEVARNATFRKKVKADVSGIWSVDYSVSIDGGLALEGIPSFFSIVPEELPKALR